MGILEWLGEALNPRSTASVDIKTEREPLPPTPIVWLCFVGSLGALGGIYYLYFAYLLQPSFVSILLAVLIGAIYLAAGYFLDLNPNTSKLGLFNAGFVDDPFCFSDDVTSSMAGARLVLAPGRFVVWSLVNAWHWLRGERSPLAD